MSEQLISAARRLLFGCAVVLCVAVLNFCLVRAAPGDPAHVMSGEAGAADETFLNQIRDTYGLNKPFTEQLSAYIGQIARLNLGYSYRYKMPVADLLLERLPDTLLLTIPALLLSILVGAWLGALAGSCRATSVDRAIGAVIVLLTATPVFLVGICLILVFSAWLGVLPAFGSQTLGLQDGLISALGDRLRHLVLPVLTLTSLNVAAYIQIMRGSVIEVRESDYVKAARSKGLREGQVFRRHILRNAISPVVALAGVQAGHLIGGAVVVETVFAWPGLGRLTFDALMAREYSVLLGIFLLTSILVVALNALTDVVHGVLDPRIRNT